LLVVGCLAGLVSLLVVCSLGQLDQLIDQSVGWWVRQALGRFVGQLIRWSVGTWQVVGSVFSVTQSVGRSVCRSVDQVVSWQVVGSVFRSLSRSGGRSGGW
jgi:hypothetical protein